MHLHTCMCCVYAIFPKKRTQTHTHTHLRCLDTVRHTHLHIYIICMFCVSKQYTMKHVVMGCCCAHTSARAPAPVCFARTWRSFLPEFHRGNFRGQQGEMCQGEQQRQHIEPLGIPQWKRTNTRMGPAWPLSRSHSSFFWITTRVEHFLKR